MNATTLHWDVTMTATSSIVHAGQTKGTITLLRRETLLTSDGLVDVPIISGNTFRGRLRRIGEELLRDVLNYQDLHPAAAHALRGGGSLARTGHEPLSGSRLATLRRLVPQISVFGAAGGGAIIDGALDVGKLIPHVKETNHITGDATTISSFDLTQLEPYTKQPDISHDFISSDPDHPDSPMLFHIETLPAGTTLSSWIRLRRPTGTDLAFLSDILTAYEIDGRIGGRIATGHGNVETHFIPRASIDTAGLPNWRDEVTNNRDEILDALTHLT